MIEKIELKGRWKLPGEEDWLNGTLFFDPEERTRLELFGSFNNTFNTSNVDVILGETDKGDITLIENWYRNRRSSRSGVIIGSYQPTMVIKGHHFEEEEDVLFCKVNFQVFNLFQWLNISGIDHDFKKKGTYSISYSEPEEINFEIGDSCTGKISFFSPLSADGIYNRIELEERCSVTFEYTKSVHYKVILTDMSRFIGFITLCSFEQSYPMSIKLEDSGYTEEFDRRVRNKDIRLFYEHNRYSPHYRFRRRHEHLVAYENIKDSFPDIIENWIKYYIKLESVFNLMLASFKQKNKFSEQKFMDNIRALESYHKQIYNKKKIPDTDHESKVERILKSCKLIAEDFKWLRGRLTKQYDPYLGERLEFLVESYKNSYVESKFKDSSVFSDIVNSRNYYAHYDTKLESRALKSIPLFRLTQKLMGLLYSCILTDIEIDKTHFESCLSDLLYE